ncbi:hypothetical protein EP47_14235 [Legionella norrlandica]|uniref:Uncharacterized protein n=1 Tax=Legionella norrlandica TaxID=1498499 RepID=A0A0A2SSZ8_9GAMM|nr:hypothetical protein [Legionella norrlandica]KGP62836.1 hypothetical protein EP47_14235 [Legionella norrlandica]
MPGFLPSWIANPLTNFFGNRIDFSNFGRTTQEQGITNYSSRQLLDRAYIWGGIIIGGAAGYFLRQQLHEEASSAALALYLAAGVTTGFLITHGQVSSARIRHRQNLIDEANNLKATIADKLTVYLDKLDEADKKDVKIAIETVIDKISHLSLSNTDRSNATLTLVKRKTGLSNLLEKIEQDILAIDTDSSRKEDAVKFWQQESRELIKQMISGETSNQPGVTTLRF